MRFRPGLRRRTSDHWRSARWRSSAISGQESKTLDRYVKEPFDAVITVCEEANEACPVFVGASERLHWSFPDPSKAGGREEQQLEVHRQVRDAIRQRIQHEPLTRATP